MITWTNCAERMPPDDGDVRIIIRSGKYIDCYSVATGSRLHDYACRNILSEDYQWTLYTEEAWSELTKVQ